jgi:hypothetical protein
MFTLPEMLIARDALHVFGRERRGGLRHRARRGCP